MLHKAQTKAAIIKDIVTAGPALVAATVPGRIKIPVPITEPIPNVSNSKAPIVLTKCLSVLIYRLRFSFLNKL